MATRTETAILEAITAQQDVLRGLLDRMEAVEHGVPEVEVTSHDAAPKAAPKTPKVTTITADDPELLSLRGQITREGKAKLIDKCATHSTDALRTLILAGGRAAREFMADKRKAATAEEEYHMVDSTNGRYARAMLERLASGKGATVVTSHTKASKVQARPRRKTPSAPDGKLTADMNDQQLLKHRPKGASDAPAAKRTWLWRTRERIAGRDPMRARSA